MSAYPGVPNNMSRVERSQWAEEMNPFGVKEAARRHLAGYHQQGTPAAPQYPTVPSQPSNPYEGFCFRPYPLSSYTPVTRPMHPAPLIPKGYAELPTSETSMPAQVHDAFQEPCSQNQWNVPRSLMAGYEPLPQLEPHHFQARETQPVTQPLRRSARDKPSVHQCDQNENSQVQSRKPNFKMTEAERTQALRAHAQALASRREGFEGREAEQRRQALEQQSMISYGKNLGQAWQASRHKGETPDPRVTISNIHKANARVLLWLENVEEAVFEE